MKRIFALILVLIMSVSLMGCGEKHKEIQISDKFPVAKAPVKTVYEAGKIVGNVYEGSFGIKFEKPENWEYLTDEEIKMIPTQEGVHYDLGCQNAESGSNVFVMYEDLIAVAGNATISEEQYINVITQGLVGNGFWVTDSGKANIGGKEFQYVTAMIDNSDSPEIEESEVISIEQSSYIRKEGEVMISVIAMAFNEDNTEDIMKNFEGFEMLEQ